MHKDDFETYTSYLGDRLWASACVAGFSPILAVVMGFLGSRYVLWMIPVVLFVGITPFAIGRLIKDAKLFKQIKSLLIGGF